MSVQMIAADGGECFGYSIDEHGRAVCNFEGAFCDCRKPSVRELLDLEVYVRDKQAEYEGWGLDRRAVEALKRAKKRLDIVRDLDRRQRAGV